MDSGTVQGTAKKGNAINKDKKRRPETKLWFQAVFPFSCRNTGSMLY
jgi:hypothetical protein